jgi:hypothetical protein
MRVPNSVAHDNDGAITNICCAIAGETGNESLHFFPSRSKGQTFLRIHSWSINGRRNSISPTLCFRIVEKAAQCICQGVQ